MTEEVLITKACKRDRTAQNALYTKYSSYWYMLCLRYNRNANDAQDVLQDALIQIFTKLDQFDSNRGIFKSWSGRIVINQNLIFLRKRRLDIDDMDNHRYIESEQDSAIDMMSSQELTGLIQQLPAGYRTIFNMYAVDGFGHKEIAKQLNISEGTSKSQLFKAKKILKEKLKVLYSR